MKIALCLSGFMRSFETTFSNLNKYLLQNYNVDIFIATWNINDLHLTSLEEPKILNTYKPVKCNIEKIINFDILPLKHKNINNKRNINSLLSMFYKIEQCNNLKSQYEKENNFIYDCVIRFRPDIQLLENIIINNLDKINIPKYGDFFGINDQMAFSNSYNMNQYCLYSKINKLINNNVMIDPELLNQTNLLDIGIPINRFDLKYNLLCHNQILDNEIREKEWTYKIRS